MAKTLSVSEFRTQLLSLIDYLPKEGVVVTRRGQPVAKLVPIEEEEVDNSSMFGALKGVLNKQGDIFSTGDAWNAES
jgi:prevent-host-death family protein